MADDDAVVVGVYCPSLYVADEDEEAEAEAGATEPAAVVDAGGGGAGYVVVGPGS